MALDRGCTLLSVDRAPLDKELMNHPSILVLQGDAFLFRPSMAEKIIQEIRDRGENAEQKSQIIEFDSVKWNITAQGSDISSLLRKRETPETTESTRNPFQLSSRAPRFSHFHVDWLLCDVLAEPDRTASILKEWVVPARCRGFCITIKFRGTEDYAVLEKIKSLLHSASHTINIFEKDQAPKEKHFIINFSMMQFATTPRTNEVVVFGLWEEKGNLVL